MNSAFDQKIFEALPLVGILRGVPVEKLRPLVEATRDGGLTNLEVTMNSPDAATQIRTAIAIGEGKMNIGAGTVTSIELLEEALSAGASFIVTPTLVAPVIHECVNRSIPIFPGAFSPSEIVRAHELGAKMIKVFPADVLGPAYIKSLLAPMPELRLMPTGGVNLKTIGDFAKSGAAAFGVGSPLFRAERIAADDWNWFRNESRMYADACRSSLRPS